MKHFLVFPLLILLALTVSARAADSSSAEEDKRPNILFCFSDDWGRYASIHRDPDRPGLNDVIETPALDAIGRRGVVFQNAFVSAPSCKPCRASRFDRDAVLPLWQQRLSAQPGIRQGGRPLQKPARFFGVARP